MVVKDVLNVRGLLYRRLLYLTCPLFETTILKSSWNWSFTISLARFWYFSVYVVNRLSVNICWVEPIIERVKVRFLPDFSRIFALFSKREKMKIFALVNLAVADPIGFDATTICCDSGFGVQKLDFLKPWADFMLTPKISHRKGLRSCGRHLRFGQTWPPQSRTG